MKLTRLISFLGAAVMLFSSCSHDTALSGTPFTFNMKTRKINDKYHMDKLAEGAYDTYEEGSYVGKLSVYPFNNRLYYITYTNDIGYYSFADNSHTIIGKIDIEPYSDEDEYVDGRNYGSICDTISSQNSNMIVNDNGIYVVLRDTVFLLDFDGNTVDSFVLPDTEIEFIDWKEWKRTISVNERYILVARDYMTDKEEINAGSRLKGPWVTEIIAIDMRKEHRRDDETGLILDAEIAGVVYADTIERILPTEEENIFYLQSLNAVYELDMEEHSQILVKYGQIGAHDYNPAEGNFYFVFYDWFGDTGLNYVAFGTATKNYSSVNRMRTLGYNSLNKMIRGDEYVEGKNVPYMYRMFFTGSDYMIWIGSKILVINADAANDARSLTVLHRDCAIGRDKETGGSYIGSMSTIMDEVDAMTEEKDDVKISRKTYGKDEFLDRIKVKMMAGDDDYDIVLLEDADDILGSLIKYRRYLPLENYPDITDGLDKCITGVKDLMTRDGHIYGIPTKLEADAIYMKNLTEDDHTLPVNYTLEDYAQLYKDNHMSGLDRESAINSLRSVIEDGMDKGEINKNAIREVLSVLKECMVKNDIGVEDNKTAYKVYDGVGGDMGTAVNSEWFDKNWKDCDTVLRALPSYNGKHYIRVKCMAYANSATKKPELAAKYLARMVSDDFRGEKLSYHRSFMTPDPDGYFTYWLSTISERENYNPRVIGYG